MNINRAPASTKKLAAEVNPFLLLISRSLLWSNLVISFTIDMLDIYTEAHPILKIPGMVIYQKAYKVSFLLLLIKDG